MLDDEPVHRTDRRPPLYHVGGHQVARRGRACTTAARAYLARHHEHSMEDGQQPPATAGSSHVQHAPGHPTYSPGKPGQTHRRHRWSGVRHARSALEIVSRGPEPEGVQASTCQKGVYPQRQRHAKTPGPPDVPCILPLFPRCLGIAMTGSSHVSRQGRLTHYTPVSSDVHVGACVAARASARRQCARELG
jgi:hypothetical protein